MLSKRILTGCLGAIAIGLSPIGAEAASVGPHAAASSAAIGQLPVAQRASNDVELARFDTPMSRGVIGIGTEEFEGRDSAAAAYLGVVAFTAAGFAKYQFLPGHTTLAAMAAAADRLAILGAECRHSRRGCQSGRTYPPSSRRQR